MTNLVTTSRAAPFWKARERPSTDKSSSKEELLHSVLDHLPDMFSPFEFLNVAIGLNAIDNAGEVDRYLQHLVHASVIYRDGPNFRRA
jgi:hypothetical protein